jgi:hypothetical protein
MKVLALDVLYQFTLTWSAVFLLILFSAAVDSYCCSFSCWEVRRISMPFE